MSEPEELPYAIKDTVTWSKKNGNLLISSSKDNKKIENLKLHTDLYNSPLKKRGKIYKIFQNLLYTFTKKEPLYLKSSNGEIWKHITLKLKKESVDGYVKVQELIEKQLVYDSINHSFVHLGNSSNTLPSPKTIKETKLCYQLMEAILIHHKDIIIEKLTFLLGSKYLSKLNKIFKTDTQLNLENFLSLYSFFSGLFHENQEVQHFLNDYHFAPGLKAECLRLFFKNEPENSPEKKIHDFIIKEKVTHPKIRTLRLSEFFKILENHPDKEYHQKFQKYQFKILVKYNKRKIIQYARTFKSVFWNALHLDRLSYSKITGFKTFSQKILDILKEKTTTQEEYKILGKEIQKNTKLPFFICTFLSTPKTPKYLEEELFEINDSLKIESLHLVHQKLKKEKLFFNKIKTELSILLELIDKRSLFTYKELHHALLLLFDILWLHASIDVKKTLSKQLTLLTLKK
jgi:hypothetical protein